MQPGQVPEVLASTAFKASVTSSSAVTAVSKSALNVVLTTSKDIDVVTVPSGCSINTINSGAYNKTDLATMILNVQVYDGNKELGSEEYTSTSADGTWGTITLENVEYDKTDATKLTIKVTAYIAPYEIYDENDKLVKRYTKAGRKAVFMTTHTVSAAPAE